MALQLAEAILSEPAPEDAEGSIRVVDTRQRSAGSREEERFLVVGAEDDEDEAESDVDDEEGEGARRKRDRGRLGVMGNASAQLSMLDMHAATGEEDQDHSGGSGLSAKAGIILVSLVPSFLFPIWECMH